MDPKAVRDRILHDHGRLREQLDAIESLAERFEKLGAEVGAELSELGIALCEVFASHLSFEDAQLAPILRAIPGKGDALADRLAREHREQRELLHYLVGRLQQESRPTTLITRELTSLCEYLRQDMEHEEANLVRA
jgi:iron-sulfur cluster repair protein YtfE (RIC family)